MGKDKRTRKRALKVVLAAWVADVMSVPEPAMVDVRDAALARLRAGGAA